MTHEPHYCRVCRSVMREPSQAAHNRTRRHRDAYHHHLVNRSVMADRDLPDRDYASDVDRGRDIA